MADNLNNATQNKIIELSQQVQSMVESFVKQTNDFTEALNKIDVNDPTARAQADAINVEYKIAFKAYLNNTPPVSLEMKKLFNSLPPDQQAAVESYIEAADASRGRALTASTDFTDTRSEVDNNILLAVAKKNDEVKANAAQTPVQTEQQNKEFVKTGGADGDKQVEVTKGETQNLLNRYPAPGGGAPIIATPTTQAGKSDTPAATPAAKNSTTATTGVAIKPGKRTQNPLSKFSSYTYQISLYMITPDAYDAFIESGRKDLNAINNVTAGAPPVSNAAQSTSVQAPGDRGRTGSPPAVSTPVAKKGGAYLIAQSGGINNTTSKRAPGFDTDFYIDNLKITHAIATKEVTNNTSLTEMSFTITEPYGFSLLTKLRKAQNTLAATTNTKNFAMAQNPARQFFIIGIRFLGYDQDGNIIDPSKIASADGDPDGNASGLFERYYDILIADMKFKITGAPVVYDIIAKAANDIIGFGSKFSTIISDIPVTADNVYNALVPATQNQPDENQNDAESLRLARKAGTPQMTSLFGKLNKDQQDLVGKGVTIPRQYEVVFIGPDADSIKNASLKSQADLDKRKIPTTTATNASESNQKTATKETPNNDLRTIKIAQGTPIIQAVSEIVKQSSYLEAALTQIENTNLSPDPKTNSYEKQENTPTQLKWFNIKSEVKNLGWDPVQGDWVYKIKYIIQSYLTPIVVAASAKNTTPYYGAHKRYEYWYTGKNSEIINYQQTLDFAFHNVTTQGYGVDSRAQGGSSDIPVTAGQPQGQPTQGRINEAMEAQNMYMTSLFSPHDYGEAKLTILGDPDFLMQSSVTSINSLYSQFYGPDGFTINPNGGQVFIEINFKEPLDYDNKSGLMNLNDSIFFYQYPASVQKDIDSRGGGISYMVKTVTSNFKNGLFTQDLSCSLNVFPDPVEEKASNQREAAKTGFVQAPGEAGRGGSPPTSSTAATSTTATDQTDGSDNRFARQGTGSAPTESGTGTTSGTGFQTSPTSFLDPAQRAQLSSINSVGSINNVMDPMQRLSQNQITIPTTTGVVQNDDAGTSAPTVFGRG